VAIDLIDANTTRHYAIPDHPDLTFPNSDWFIYLWTRVDDNTGTLFQYIFSNNNFSAANSLNIFLSETSEATRPDIWNFNTQTLAGFATTSTGGDGLNRLLVLQREGSRLKLYFCVPHGTPSLEADFAYSDGAIDGGVWNIGRRVDGNTSRYYEEHFGDVVKGNRKLTLKDIRLLGQGHKPTDVIPKAAIDVWFDFRHAGKFVVDKINGHVATRQGSGLLTSRHMYADIFEEPDFQGFVPAVAASASLLLLQQSFRQ